MITSLGMGNTLLVVQPPLDIPGAMKSCTWTRGLDSELISLFWGRERRVILLLAPLILWHSPVTAWRGHQTAPCLSSSPGNISTGAEPALAVRVFCFEAAPSETPKWLLALSSTRVTVPGQLPMSLSFILSPPKPPPNLSAVSGNSHQF